MVAKKIKSILIYKDMSITALAGLLGKSVQNTSNLLKKDDFRESDLRTIAEKLGYDLKIEFVDKETGEII